VTDPAKETPPLTVLYDGACPLCRREIGIYRGLRPNTPVCFADLSDTALPLPGWRWLARAGRLPGAAWVMEGLYRFFLRWRPALQRWAARLDRPA